MNSARGDGVSNQSTKYYSYLLRLWQEDAELGWHIYIQDVKTGVQRRFLSLESLMAYLQAHMEPDHPE